MVSRQDLRRWLLGRPVALAYGLLVGLYLVRYVRVQPLQIPAYLLIATYDLVEVAVPALNPYHPVGFPAFLYALAVVGAAVSRRLRTDQATGIGSATGGAALVVAALSFLFAAAVGGPLVSATDNPTPLAVTATAGLLFASLGLWLLRRPAGAAGPAA